MQKSLEARTQDMIRLQALLKDEKDDFFFVEPDMIGPVAAEDFGLVAVEDRRVKVLFLAPYLATAAVEPAQLELNLKLEKRLPGITVEIVEVEPPFEEPAWGIFLAGPVCSTGS